MLRKIGVNRLRLDMFIHELCGSWMEHPFWRTRFLLKDPEDIRRIAESGIKEVWIDTAKGLDLDADSGQRREEVAAIVQEYLEDAADTHAGAMLPPDPPPEPLDKELRRAARVCASAKVAVVEMFSAVRMGKAIDTEAVNILVGDISASVMRNPGALISLARLKTVDDYTYMHSVAVCALMVALARQMRMSESEMREAGMAGLLHDMGKAMIPTEILDKPGKLTDAEFEVMRSHPEQGHRILSEGGGAGEIPLDVCLHHHEKMDGSGYPHRLPGDRISRFARMGAVCDVYDAITSDRPYKAGWNPAEAMGKMAEWGSGHFDPDIFQSFVKTVGIYPIGALVRLSSGQLGVVTDQSSDSLLMPVVRVFYSAKSNGYIAPETVDISRPGCRLRIVCREDPEKWGFKNLDDHWRPASTHAAS